MNRALEDLALGHGVTPMLDVLSIVWVPIMTRDWKAMGNIAESECIGVEILAQVERDYQKMVADRRFIHAHPGVSFDLEQTVSYVSERLDQLEISYEPIGRAGIVAEVGTASRGKTFLIRADMDALPIEERSGCDYAAANGAMHACGHDLHTAMLLEVARILKSREGALSGRVLLMFQPSEETFEGARDMIEAGLLDRYAVDAGMMGHVTVGMPCPTGTVVVCDPGVSAPAADYFTIEIQGHGCHGSMPNMGVDPITVAAHLVIGLQEIQSRELGMSDEVALTVGSIHAGDAGNAIPDAACLRGTLRTFDEDVRSRVKERMVQISEAIAGAYRATAAVSFGPSCPTLFNNPSVARDAVCYAKALLGGDAACTATEFAERLDGNVPRVMGSEDFAYVSHEIPTVMVSLAAGNASSGYAYPQHHPMVTFDERVMVNGAAVYAYTALCWLADH